MAINLDELSQRLNAYEIPSGSETLVIDENGLLVAYSNPEIFNNQSKALMVNDLVEGFNKDLTKFELGGKTYISAKLTDAPWVLWISVPTQFFYSGVRETSINFLIIYLVTLLISIFIANALSKMISTPILRLRSHAEFIGRGEYTQEISSDLLHQKDEIGHFAMTFETMRDNILQRENELEHNYMEIQALYEEMAASEEVLKENYEALNLYKDKVEYYAFHNAQTGFFNRDYLIQSLNKLAQLDALSGMVLICFSYKELNHYSETVGQTILELIHYKLGLTVSKHMPHDEAVQLFDLSMGKFGLLLNAVHLDTIDPLILAIKTEVASMNTLDALTVKVSMAVGGYALDAMIIGEDQGIEVIEKAESALLSNQFNLNHESDITWFDDALYQKREYETQIESGLYEALNKNEISVVYQPQYDHVGNIIGAEALMRWKHGKMGNIPPVEFIPRAESLGIIDQLDQFMISEVHRFKSELKEMHNIILPMSVNISVVELLDPLFIEHIELEVKKYEIKRSSLVFELTETAFSKHFSLVKDNIAQLMALDYQLHLDDFGTGYSSLAYLSEFPVNAIKIDRSFVAAFLENKKVSNIISTMIDLARKIDAEVIAEGVETIEQFNGLLKLGCFNYQGYLLSRPIDGEALKNLFLLSTNKTQ